jgi:cation transport ATPase
LGIEGEVRAEGGNQEDKSNLPKVEKVEEISLEKQENLEKPNINVKPSPSSSQLVSESNNSDSISTSTVEIEQNNFEEDLEQGLAKNPVKVSLEDSQTRQQAVKAMDISRMIYIALLLVLIVFLLINILVRATVQHKSVIIQSVVLIILILVLIFFDFDFMVKIKNSASNIILF